MVLQNKIKSLLREVGDELIAVIQEDNSKENTIQLSAMLDTLRDKGISIPDVYETLQYYTYSQLSIGLIGIPMETIVYSFSKRIYTYNIPEIANEILEEQTNFTKTHHKVLKELKQFISDFLSTTGIVQSIEDFGSVLKGIKEQAKPIMLPSLDDSIDLLIILCEVTYQYPLLLPQEYTKN